MPRKITIATIAVSGILAVGAGTALSSGSASGGSGQPQSASSQHGQGMGMGMGHGQHHGQGMRGQGSSNTALTLTSAARADLLYMREEEKLAQDVYAALATRYPDAPFARITTSEARHARAVQRQLDRAGIADPTTASAAGEFENADLQQLYDDLVARGTRSLEEALKVGVLIEQTDIADLQAAVKTTTDAQLQRVYSNLQRASEQHLAAFAAAQSS